MWKKKMKKQFLSIAIVVSMIFTGCVSAFAGSLKDTQGHWAESTIQSWADQGLISGYKDGTFKPNANVTRSEFIVLINKAFGMTKEQPVSFTDVQASNWYYKDLSKAVAAGYLVDVAGGEFKPAQKVTRQEASSILVKLLSLKPSNSADGVTDVKNLTEASRGAVGAVVDAKLMEQNAKGLFRSNDNITRAEAVVVLTRALKYKKSQSEIVYAKPGVYGPASGLETVSKNVRITSPGVTLQNMTIEGNLAIEESVGNGDVFLKQVSVKGTTTVNGGGANSIHFENSIIVKIVVNKKDGSVRIVVEGTTEVRDVILQSGAKLEESGVTGTGFQNVTLAESLPADSKVTLSGKFETVDVLAAKIKVDIPQGQVDNLNIDKKAEGVSVDVSKEAKIVELILAAVAKIIGQGVIETAKITANGATIEQTPNKVEVGQGVNAEVGGKPTVNTEGSTTGVGGSPGGNGSPSTVSKVNLLSAISVAQATYDQAVEGNEKGQYRFGSKSELFAGIQTAKSVYDNSSSTQVQVDAAIETLNVKVMIFGYDKNQYSIAEQFANAYENSKRLINSTTEEAGPGQAGPGSKAKFAEAISAAHAIIKNSAATPAEIQNGYYALQQARNDFYNQLTSSDYSKLQVVVSKAEQALASAVEGDNPGQYRMGAKAILQMDLSHSQDMIKYDYEMPQHDVNSMVFQVWNFLNKFEADKIAENATVITAASPTTSPDTNNHSFYINASVSGAVYIVPYTEFPTSFSDLQLLVGPGKSAVTASVNADVQTQISAETLNVGNYKVYHVDASEKLSKPLIGLMKNASGKIGEAVKTEIVSGVITNTITWTDSSSLGVTSYFIFRGLTDEHNQMTEITQYISPLTQQYVDNDPDLLPGTKYYYRIGINGQNNGVATDAISITTPAN